MAALGEIATIVGILKLLPEVVEVGKDVWKKLRPPEKLAVGPGRDGVAGTTYYSGRYKFAISLPDDNWQFWEPSPQFLAGLGPAFAMPVRDVPIMVLSKQTVRLYRPTVIVVVEDVGSFSNANEVAQASRQFQMVQGWTVQDSDVHVSAETNSAVLIASRAYLHATVYQVQQIYLHAGRSYFVTATYVPISDDSPTLFADLKEVMNSFQLIT